MSTYLTHALAALTLLTGGMGIAHAAPGVVRHGADGSSPILTGVTVPAGAETLYLSGQVPPVATLLPIRQRPPPMATRACRPSAFSAR